MPRETINPTSEFPVRVGWDRQGSVQVSVHESPVSAEGGLCSSLDRQTCNALIRVLRRARDAAFGRDE